MERSVVTLKTAKKLEAVGWPTDPEFAWVPYTQGDVWRGDLDVHWQVEPYHGQSDVVRAPTAQEIADQLPKHKDGKWLSIEWDGIADEPEEWFAKFLDVSGHDGPVTHAPTMAEALALLWLKLKETGDGKAD